VNDNIVDGLVVLRTPGKGADETNVSVILMDDFMEIWRLFNGNNNGNAG
jgi:hypothetical protein